MYLLNWPFFALASVFLQHRVVAELDQTLRERGATGDLSFCFDTDSICTASNHLWDQCSNYQATYDDVKWFQCICANGYVSVDEACFWCQEAYNLFGSDSSYSNKRACSSVGVAVAPIPSSILSLESQFNKTYTGIISGPGPASTGVLGSSSATAMTTTIDSTQQMSTLKPSSTTIQTTALTANSKASQGVTSEVTLDGGNQSPTTVTPTTNSDAQGGPLFAATTTTIPPKAGPSSGSGSGSVRWCTSSVTVMTCVIACVLAGLYLI